MALDDQDVRHATDTAPDDRRLRRERAPAGDDDYLGPRSSEGARDPRIHRIVVVKDLPARRARAHREETRPGAGDRCATFCRQRFARRRSPSGRRPVAQRRGRGAAHGTASAPGTPPPRGSHAARPRSDACIPFLAFSSRQPGGRLDVSASRTGEPSARAGSRHASEAADPEWLPGAARLRARDLLPEARAAPALGRPPREQASTCNQTRGKVSSKARTRSTYAEAASSSYPSSSGRLAPTRRASSARSAPSSGATRSISRSETRSWNDRCSPPRACEAWPGCTR